MYKIKPKNRLKIVIIVGLTASGKSDLGINLAKKFNGEIISADSRQVYKKMDIGTGKVLRDKTLPNSKFKILNNRAKPSSGLYGHLKLKNNFYSSGIRHHLLDVISPKKQFTADDFKKLGQKAINDILSRGKVPIIVGGTGFYIDVLLGRVAIAEVPPNLKLRLKLEKQSIENLYKKLKKLDPGRARTIDPKNKRRLIRALEIIFTPHHDRVNKRVVKNGDLEYDPLFLGIKISKKELAKRIKNRLNERLKQGMISEVKGLLKKGISKKRLYDLGLEYRWISQYLNKEVGYKEMREGLLRDIIKYSKRQMTWFKRNKEIHWIKTRKEAEGLTSDFVRSHWEV